MDLRGTLPFSWLIIPVPCRHLSPDQMHGSWLDCLTGSFISLGSGAECGWEQWELSVGMQGANCRIWAISADCVWVGSL